MAIIPAAAQAGVECAPRTALLAGLATKFHEAPVAIGLASSGALIEILTSADGETWTLLISRPDGTSCLVASGQDWQKLAPVVPADVPL